MSSIDRVNQTQNVNGSQQVGVNEAQREALATNKVDFNNAVSKVANLYSVLTGGAIAEQANPGKTPPQFV